MSGYRGGMTTNQQHQVPGIELGDGREMPQLGYGVWQIPDDVTARVVQVAINAGYRSIDTAAIYENEAGVGEAIRASGVDRNDLFITTKLWNDAHAAHDARAACRRSLDLLGIESLDLYLIHWPSPLRDQYVEAWRTLVELREQGLTQSIGVSNFGIEHLERIIEATAVKPVLDQVELHPYFQQRELRAWCEDQGIAIEAWSPLGQGGELLADPVITTIAEELDRTPAQVVLRWHLQHGHVVIPKSQTPARIAENFDVFDFALTGEQLIRIDALDRGEAGRIGPDPATAQF